MKTTIGLLVIATLALASCTDMDDTNTNVTVDTNEAIETQDDMNNMDDMNSDMDVEEGVMVGGAMMVPSLDIVDNAVNADNVTTLVAAVGAAGLVDTLKSEGPFTVFAPTDAAFAALPEGTVDTLLMPENQEDLVGILTYHVVSGSYTVSDLTDGLNLLTVNGDELRFTIENGVLMINGAAMVETADVISSNGVTHVIDSVLLPESQD